MEVVSSSSMMPEGNSGDQNTFELCVMLTDVQSGLDRDLIFSVSIEFGTAGKECLLHH